MISKYFIYLVLHIGISASAFFETIVSAGELDCGSIKNYDGIGPWDYNDPANHRAPGPMMESFVGVVERVHLTPSMMSLQTGATGHGILGLIGDLDYTLRKLPNHPKALDMVSRLQIREGGKLPQKDAWSSTWTRSAECYFDRALRFRPDDLTIRQILGIHLHRLGKYQEALKQYKIVESGLPNSAELHYNMGLTYFELKDFDKSLAYARKAYDGGYPLPGLREKLKSVEKWTTSPVTVTTEQKNTQPMEFNDKNAHP